jgi:hypothetical protein
MNALARYFRDFAAWVKGDRPCPHCAAQAPKSIPELKAAYAHARESHHGQRQAYSELQAAVHAALKREREVRQ